MLDELSEQNLFLSNEHKQEIILCVKERCTIYADILHYLHNPEKLNSDGKHEIFNINYKSTIVNVNVQLLEKISDNNKNLLKTLTMTTIHLQQCYQPPIQSQQLLLPRNLRMHI